MVFLVAPTAPLNLTLTSLTSTSVALNWTAPYAAQPLSPLPGTLRYVLQQCGPTPAKDCTDLSNFLSVANVSSSDPVTQYLVTSLLPDSSYQYRVQAVNANGSSDFTSPYSVHTLQTAPNSSCCPAYPNVNVNFTMSAVVPGNAATFLATISWPITDGIMYKLMLFMTMTNIGADLPSSYRPIYQGTTSPFVLTNVPANANVYVTLQCATIAPQSDFTAFVVPPHVKTPVVAAAIPTWIPFTAADIKPTSIALNWVPDISVPKCGGEVCNVVTYTIFMRYANITQTISNLPFVVSSYVLGSSEGIMPNTQYSFTIAAVKQGTKPSSSESEPIVVTTLSTPDASSGATATGTGTGGSDNSGLNEGSTAGTTYATLSTAAATSQPTLVLGLVVIMAAVAGTRNLF